MKYTTRNFIENDRNIRGTDVTVVEEFSKHRRFRIENNRLCIKTVVEVDEIPSYSHECQRLLEFGVPPTPIRSPLSVVTSDWNAPKLLRSIVEWSS